MVVDIIIGVVDLRSPRSTINTLRYTMHQAIHVPPPPGPSGNTCPPPPPPPPRTFRSMSSDSHDVQTFVAAVAADIEEKSLHEMDTLYLILASQ